MEAHYRSYQSMIISDVLLSLHGCAIRPLGKWRGVVVDV